MIAEFFFSVLILLVLLLLACLILGAIICLLLFLGLVGLSRASPGADRIRQQKREERQQAPIRRQAIYEARWKAKKERAAAREEAKYQKAVEAGKDYLWGQR